MSAITTHVLDTSLGKPAAGVAVQLSRRETIPTAEGGARAAESFVVLATATTNGDGRISGWLAPGPLEPGVYRLSFDTATYFSATQRTSFYPSVEVIFEVSASEAHYHVPLLLSPYGYSTYRGS